MCVCVQGIKGTLGGVNAHFIQGPAVTLRLAVNCSDPVGLPQTAYAMAGENGDGRKQTGKSVRRGIIILRVHPRCMEIRGSDPPCGRARGSLRRTLDTGQAGGTL